MVAKQERITIADNGTINIPVEVLARYGLKAGDKIGLVATDSGIILGREDQIAEQLLDQIGTAMRKAYPNMSEDEFVQMMIQRGRDEIRPELLKELYDIDVDE